MYALFFKQYHHHCLELESILTKVEGQTGHGCFPVILGRKPSISEKLQSPSCDKENASRAILKDRQNYIRDQNIERPVQVGKLQFPYIANRNFSAMFLSYSFIFFCTDKSIT